MLLLARFHRPFSLLLAGLALLAPAAMRAQAVEPGAYVRILAPSAADSLITGTVLEMDSVSLLLAPQVSAGSRAVRLEGIERLEIRHRGRRRTFNGGAIGVLAGAVVGYGLTEWHVRSTDCEYVCGAAVAGGSIAGGLGGLIAGAVIGSRYRDRDRWEAVEVPRR